MVVDQGRLVGDFHWLQSVLQVPFSALTLV